MATKKQTARQLAFAFLASDWEQISLSHAARITCGASAAWQDPLITSILAAFSAQNFPSPGQLCAFIEDDTHFTTAWKTEATRPVLVNYTLSTPEAPAPAACFQDLKLPQFATKRALADYLELTMGELYWLADASHRLAAQQSGPLQHYRYTWREKRYGPPRLIEAPKPRLKNIQRRLLDDILCHVPLHDAAHGFRSGRNCLSHAAVHVGQPVVMRLDLQDFFPSVPVYRVHTLFTRLGYGADLSRIFSGLVTNKTPRSVFARFKKLPRPQRPNADLYTQPHLPQGAPTSPVLANLYGYRLDCRLRGLAQKFGLTYSRYADDMAFSGSRDFARKTQFIHIRAAAIALDEGFLLNTRKTRVMYGSQRQKLCGVTINQHPNLPRAEFDRLKAILHNCRKFGPDSQNHENLADFRAHLNGRVCWAEQINPEKSTKLRRLFNKINWA